MKNLNEFFKRKLEGGEFSGEDSAWAELEARLNKAMPVQEKWYKRRGFFFWMAASLMIGAGVAVLWNGDVSKDRSALKSVSLHSNERSRLGSASSIEKVTNPTTQQDFSRDLKSQEKSTKNQASENVHSVPSSSIASSSQGPSVRISADPLQGAESFSRGGSQNHPADAQGLTLISSNHSSSPIQENKGLDANDRSEAMEKPLLGLSPTPFSLLSSLGLAGMEGDIPLGQISSLMPVSENALIPRKWFYSAAFSAGLMQSRSFAQEMPNQSSGVLQRRKEQETPLWVPFVSADYRVHYQGFTLSSGMQYAQWGETRNYSDDFLAPFSKDSTTWTVDEQTYWNIDSVRFTAIQYVNNPISIDTNIIYYSQGDSIFYTGNIPGTVQNSVVADTLIFYRIDSTLVQIADTSFMVYKIERMVRVGNTGNASLRGRNITTYVEVPLMLGYEWRGRRWGLGIETGLAMGRLVRVNTLYLSADETGIVQTAGGQYQQWLVNYQARMNLSYRIQSSWRLEFSPVYRRTLQGVLNNSAGFNQRYHSFGAALGLRYSF